MPGGGGEQAPWMQEELWACRQSCCPLTHSLVPSALRPALAPSPALGQRRRGEVSMQTERLAL